MTNKKVLVVDDDDAIIPLLEVTIRAAGYDVKATTRPADALDLIEREAIDILVSDVDMPGLDGLELVSRVKTKFPWVVRILLTANGTVDVAMAAINRGEVFRFITKPWSRQDFMDTLDAASGRSDELRAQNSASHASARREAKLKELEMRFPGITVREGDGSFHLLDVAKLDALAKGLGITL
jgi:DNA-binding NtrC family response regulator